MTVNEGFECSKCQLRTLFANTLNAKYVTGWNLMTMFIFVHELLFIWSLILLYRSTVVQESVEYMKGQTDWYPFAGVYRLETFCKTCHRSNGIEY